MFDLGHWAYLLFIFITMLMIVYPRYFFSTFVFIRISHFFLEVLLDKSVFKYYWLNNPSKLIVNRVALYSQDI